MSATEDLVENNRQYAATLDQGGKPMPPARKIAILTCHVYGRPTASERFLGLEIGDAHVIRNAGGRASDDALRSLIISSQLLGTREYLVIHHSDCGHAQLLERRSAQQTRG